MLKYQITLILVLIGCIAFVACERAQEALMPVMPDPEPGMMLDYTSWEHSKMLDGAVMEFGGDAHDLGARTIYFNEAAAMANMEGTDYPVGSMIVKEAMDTTNTFISQISTMTKIDSEVNDGWEYGVTGPASETAVDKTMINTLSAEMAAGACVGCHTKAPSGKSVFVSLKTGEGETEGMDGDGTDDMNGDGADGMNGGTDGMNGDGA